MHLHHWGTRAKLSDAFSLHHMRQDLNPEPLVLEGGALTRWCRRAVTRLFKILWDV